MAIDCFYYLSISASLLLLLVTSASLLLRALHLLHFPPARIPLARSLFDIAIYYLNYLAMLAFLLLLLPTSMSLLLRALQWLQPTPARLPLARSLFPRKTSYTRRLATPSSLLLCLLGGEATSRQHYSSLLASVERPRAATLPCSTPSLAASPRCGYILSTLRLPKFHALLYAPALLPHLQHHLGVGTYYQPSGCQRSTRRHTPLRSVYYGQKKDPT